MSKPKIIIVSTDEIKKIAASLEKNPRFADANKEFAPLAKSLWEKREASYAALKDEWDANFKSGGAVSWDIKSNAIDRNYEKSMMDLRLRVNDKYDLGDVPVMDWQYKKHWLMSLDPRTEKIDKLSIENDQLGSDFMKSLTADQEAAGGPSKLKYNVAGELDKFSKKTQDIYKRQEQIRKEITELKVDYPREQTIQSASVTVSATDASEAGKELSEYGHQKTRYSVTGRKGSKRHTKSVTGLGGTR